MALIEKTNCRVVVVVAFINLFSFLLPELSPLFAQRRLLWNALVLNKSDTHLFFKSWTIESEETEDTNVSQLAFPFSVTLHSLNNVSFRVRGARVWSSFSIKDKEEQNYNAFTDIKVDGSFLLPKHLGLITLGVNLPTGSERLNLEELVVAKAIAEDALDFPISLYGAGWEFNSGIFFSYGIGRLTFGVGASYFHRRQFKLFGEDIIATLAPSGAINSIVDPGDELTVSFGFDVDLPYGEFSADMYHTSRQKDKLAGVEIYDPGKKLVITGSIDLKYPRLPLSLPLAINLWVTHRSKYDSKFLPFSDDFQFVDIIREDLSENPSQVEFGTNVQLNLGFHQSLVLSGRLKSFAQNDENSEGSSVLGGGLGYRIDGWRLGPIDWITLDFMFRHYDGHFFSLGKRFELTGREFVASFSLSL